MKRTSLLVLALSATTLAACDGLGEAFSAHTDVVATAGSQQLTVTRLGDLLGKAKMQIPLNRDVALLLARDLWVPYQLLGVAAARGDSLKDTKAIESAAAAMLENAKLGRFMQTIADKLPVEAGSEASYLAGKGGLYSARHILFMLPQNAPPLVRDSIHRLAESVAFKVTDANFAAMAKQYSGDNTKDKGGELGVFPVGMMVKPFGDALAKLKPGEISRLVETQFGFHIVQRNRLPRPVHRAQPSDRGEHLHCADPVEFQDHAEERRGDDDQGSREGSGGGSFEQDSDRHVQRRRTHGGPHRVRPARVAAKRPSRPADSGRARLAGHAVRHEHGPA